MFIQNKFLEKGYLIPVLLVLFLSACATEPVREKVGALDTPEHHYFSGLTLFEKGGIPGAEREFTLAAELDPKHAYVFAGKALISASKKDFKQAEKDLKSARKKAANDTQKIKVFSAGVRVRILGVVEEPEGYGVGDWLRDLESEFSDLPKKAKKDPEVLFFFGKAYKTGLEFEKAKAKFGKVMELNGSWVRQARKEWDLMHKIESAMPGTKIGKIIAIRDTVSRADAAALFVEELGVERIFEENDPKFNPSFKKPGGGPRQITDRNKGRLPEDVRGHPLRTDMEIFIRLGISGLRTYPDMDWHPDEPVSRGEFAMLFQDVMSKVNREQGLETKFIGQASPFPDVRNDLYNFNAIMLATSLGIMKVEDLRTRRFNPMGTIPGVDAVLSIQKIKESVRLD